MCVPGSRAHVSSNRSGDTEQRDRITTTKARATDSRTSAFVKGPRHSCRSVLVRWREIPPSVAERWDRVRPTATKHRSLYAQRMAWRERPEVWVAPTFGQRLGGRLLDTLLFAALALVLARLLSGMTLTLVGFVLAAVYEIGAVLIYGQTLGKRIVGTRVVNFDSTPLQLWQAVARFAVYLGPSVILEALGLSVGADVWILFVVLLILRPPLHRGLHAFAARTIVVPT
jgi:uncharacterized RDD family membrane protein YckC